MDNFNLRRKVVATLFEPAAVFTAQTMPTIFIFTDLPVVWGGHKAPANAADIHRSALSAEGHPSGFSKPMRRLTEHMKIE